MGRDESNYKKNLVHVVLSTTLGRAKFMKDRSNVRIGEIDPAVYWISGSCYEQNEMAMIEQ